MLTPRHLWLKLRINSIFNEIQKASEIDDIDKYIKILREFGEELLWAADEWNKCYKDGK